MYVTTYKDKNAYKFVFILTNIKKNIMLEVYPYEEN